ncbi:unnamed protein product [Chrysodeixis includens]|uniref:Uncharacterized protein n=1 Tax=Chrysodeixis includens TaxID=689277 RepID=A0A9N8PWQ8_CHRIL|nr:unnamed protein product [Chrysodeixis includens]
MSRRVSMRPDRDIAQHRTEHTECFCKHTTIRFPHVLVAGMNSYFICRRASCILVFPAHHETKSFSVAGACMINLGRYNMINSMTNKLKKLRSLNISIPLLSPSNCS